MKKIKVLTLLTIFLIAALVMVGFTYAQNNDIDVANAATLDTVFDYMDELYDFNQEHMEPFSGNAGVEWWNDIRNDPLLQRPSYGLFGFDFKPGDIIHEEVGMPGLGWTPFAGHTLMIEGRMYDENYGYFWSVIESGVRRNGFLPSPGVNRSLIDDERFLALRGHVLRVPNVTMDQRKEAVAFALAQYGKPWAIQLGSAPTCIDTEEWMCSTLVWAAWMSVGIEIVRPNWAGGILPLNIFNSNRIETILCFNTMVVDIAPLDFTINYRTGWVAGQRTYSISIYNKIHSAYKSLITEEWHMVVAQVDC